MAGASPAWTMTDRCGTRGEGKKDRDKKKGRKEYPTYIWAPCAYPVLPTQFYEG